jgi:ADP-ribosylglycohydrolase
LGYDLSRTPDQIRPDYTFDVTCQGTVPAALCCFLGGTSYEDTVRHAISLGGDSDTLACIAGGVAGAFWGVPEWIWSEAEQRLDDHLRGVLARFASRFGMAWAPPSL